MYTELEFKDLPQEVTEGFEERVEHLKEFNFKIINVVKEDIIENYYLYKIYAETNGVFYIYSFKFLDNRLKEVQEDCMSKTDVKFFTNRNVTF